MISMLALPGGCGFQRLPARLFPFGACPPSRVIGKTKWTWNGDLPVFGSGASRCSTNRLLNWSGDIPGATTALKPSMIFRSSGRVGCSSGLKASTPAAYRCLREVIPLMTCTVSAGRPQRISGASGRSTPSWFLLPRMYFTGASPQDSPVLKNRTIIEPPRVPLPHR